MPYTNVMIHLIWTTKNVTSLITNELKPQLLQHIKENSKKKGIHIDIMNCVSDHIHMIVSLGREQTIAKVVMLLKGESSFWVNKQKLINRKFEWQDEYIALSICYFEVDKVRSYIATQEAHHKKESSVDEYDAYMKFQSNEAGSAKADDVSDNVATT